MPSNIFTKILNWLRAGYPQGIPRQDYVALFGILHRDLTEDEITQIARELQEGPAGLDGEITREEIQEEIRRSIHEEPTAADVKRVASHLAAGGWPLQALGGLDETETPGQ